MFWVLAWLLSLISAIISFVTLMIYFSKAFFGGEDELKSWLKVIAFVFLTAILGWTAWVSAAMS